MSAEQLHVDVLHRFSFDELPVRGQWVRLHQTLADACSVQDYPAAVQRLLGEMFTAVAMLADNLKFDGAVALQSKGGGSLRQTLAECREHQLLRGIAHFAEDGAAAPARPDELLSWLQGTGGTVPQLALSLIPQADSGKQTYQAFVPLTRPGLAANLEDYFAHSEQLPTRLFFAHAEGGATHTKDHEKGNRQGNSVTGLCLQRLPSADLAGEVALAAHDEAWRTIEAVADTVSAGELGTLSPAQLLRRLFAELPCRLHEGRQLVYRCTCNRQKTDRTLRLLGERELADMLAEQGEITVDCQFCGKRYGYDAVDISQLTAQPPGPQRSGGATGGQVDQIH